MYRELLLELIQNHRWAKLQEPCTEGELREAEGYVGYPFPEELKSLLRETNGDGWFLLSARKILENAKVNREILREAFDTAEEFHEKVDRHIFFATNGCGDFYGYRVLPNGEPDTTAIYLWEHETFDHHMAAKDIPELIVRYYCDEI